MSIVGRQTETKPLDYWIHQARKGSNFRQQQIAFAYLDEAVNEPRVQTLLKDLLNDEFWALREAAVSFLSISEQAFEPEVLNKIKDVAVKDPKASVRVTAVDYLTKTDRTELYPQIEEVLEQTVKDSSYSVLSLSLLAYHQINPKKALEHAKVNQHIKNERVVSAVAQILLAEKQPEARTYLRTALLKTSDQMSKLSLMRELSNFLESSPPEDGDIDLLKNLAEHDNVWFVRFFAVKILSNYRTGRPDIDTFIQGLKTSEKNPRLKEMYIKNF
jgi:aminopeptidase N